MIAFFVVCLFVHMFACVHACALACLRAWAFVCSFERLRILLGPETKLWFDRVSGRLKRVCSDRGLQ